MDKTSPLLSFGQVGQRVIAKPEDMWTLSSRSVILSACDAVQICVNGLSNLSGAGAAKRKPLGVFR